MVWGDCVYPFLSRRHDELVECGRRFYPGQMHRALRQSGFDIVYSSHFLGWGFPVALVLAAAHRMRRPFSRGTSADSAGERSAAGDDRPLPSWLNSTLARCTYWEWQAGQWGLKMPLGVSRLILARKSARRPVSAVEPRPERVAIHQTAAVDRCP
jgi:hypothetical protein